MKNHDSAYSSYQLSIAAEKDTTAVVESSTVEIETWERSYSAGLVSGVSGLTSS